MLDASFWHSGWIDPVRNLIWLKIWEMKKRMSLRREAHVRVKMYKAPQLRSAFRSWDVEKVHAAVARSTFPSQNVQNTAASEHFWKLRCRKSARRCGGKHASKSKCTKHKVRSTFWNWDVEKVHAIVARSTVRSQKWTQLRGTEHFWTFRCRCAWQAQGNTLPFTTQQLQLRDITLHYATLRYTTLITLHYITLHLHYPTLHYIRLHYTTLHYTRLE